MSRQVSLSHLPFLAQPPWRGPLGILIANRSLPVGGNCPGGLQGGWRLYSSAQPAGSSSLQTLIRAGDVPGGDLLPCLALSSDFWIYCFQDSVGLLIKGKTSGLSVFPSLQPPPGASPSSLGCLQMKQPFAF